MYQIIQAVADGEKQPGHGLTEGGGPGVETADAHGDLPGIESPHNGFDLVAVLQYPVEIAVEVNGDDQVVIPVAVSVFLFIDDDFFREEISSW